MNKKWIAYKDAEKFMRDIPNLSIDHKTIKKCYFLSKMICTDERNKIGKYN